MTEVENERASARSRSTAALRDIARALSTAWDLDTTLDLIARKTTEVMHVDSCSIYLLDPGGETLRLRATTGLARRALGLATLEVGEGMTGHAVAQNRPVFARDAQHNPHFKWVKDASEGAFHSLLAIPLLIEEKPIGALNVQTLAPHTFTPEEVEILSLIGDLAAGALAKAQLHDSQRRQIEELEALAEVSELVTSPQYMDDVLDVVTNMAARLMNAAVCSIFLIDDEGHRLELRSSKHTTGPALDRSPRTVGEGVVGRVAQTGEPAYVRDVRSDSDYLDAELARREGLVSLLAVPLSVRERVIGVFNCYTDAPRAFSPEQRALFLTLANQTALAIEHGRLATNAALIREIHHRIKNNLQTVAMLMQLQLSELSQMEEVSASAARRALEASMHQVHSIAAVHEALSERGFHLVNVKDVLQRIVHMVSGAQAPRRQIAISVEGEDVLLASRAATNLALVVNELVQNALDHAFPSRTEGQVTITIGRAPGELLVTVADDGIGIADGARPGLGTEIVETLVREELQGQLTTTTEKGGTEICVRLPYSD
ncbi:MAG: GAF domain-containing protein [Candidatus Promineifilaceae bacterium]|nr:GAF domain-containing protein [Candidatus Promineifilaceae bacterium]